VFRSRITPNGWGSHKAICDATSCQQTGVLDSIVGGFIHAQYDRGMNEEEDEEIIELIKRKIPALELKFKEFLREREGFNV